MSVVCAPCSTGFGRERVQVRHDTIAEVALHSRNGAPVRVVTSVVPMPVPPVVEAPAPREVEVGSAWVLDGVRVRVKVGKSGRPYCVGVRHELVQGERPEWTFEAGSIGRRGEGRPMTVSEIAEFGHCCGFCVFCNRALDDTRSVNAGYGPTCAGKYDLPWG